MYFILIALKNGCKMDTAIVHNAEKTLGMVKLSNSIFHRIPSAMYKLAVVVKYVKGFPIQDDYYSVLGVIFPTNYDATFQVLF